MKYRPLSYGISITENSKDYKQHTYIKPHVKYKYAILSHQSISPNISTEID